MTAADPVDRIREALISVIWYADQVIAEEAAAATSPGMLRRSAALGCIAVAALDLVRAVDAAPEDERPAGWRTDGHPLGEGEVGRLRAALQVCERTVHLANPSDADLHAAQQASGAYWTDWQPEYVHDDLPDFQYRGVAS